MNNTRQQKSILVEDYVPRAYWEIFLDEGRRPTIDRVVAWLEKNGLDGRNRNTISEGIKRCWDDTRETMEIFRAFPGAPAEAKAITLQLWKLSLSVAHQQYEAAKAAYMAEAAAKIAAAEAETAVARTEVQRANTALSQQAEAVKELRANILTLQANLSDAQRQVVAVEKKLTASEQTRTNLSQTNESLKADIEAIKESHADALRQENERYADLKRALMSQIDQERVAKQEAEKARTEAVAAADAERRQSKDQETNLTAEISKLREQLAVAEGHAKATDKQLSDQEARITQLNAENKALAASNAEQVATLKAQIAVWEKRYLDLAEQGAEYLAQVESLTGENTTLRAHSAGLTSQIEALQAQIQTMTGTNERSKS